MELRHYFGIVRRFWPLVVGLPLLVALLTIGLWVWGPQRYGLLVTMQVNQREIASDPAAVTLPDYNNYNSWAASEYVVDDLLQIVQTQQFAKDVVADIQINNQRDLDPNAVREGLSAERKHRTVYLSIEADTREYAEWISRAAVRVLQAKGMAYWGRDEALNVVPLDVPERASRAGGTVGLALDLAVRTLLALLLAIGLAFLRHYLDQTVRRRGDVEALGFDIVGAIPVAKGAKS